MPGLSDIARSFRTVKVRGAEIAVPGISVEGIAYLFHKFPVIRELITGKTEDIAADRLIALAPDAVASIIALGTGSTGELIAADEITARSLGAEDQLNLVDAIIQETMPGGAGPFVEKLTAMFLRLGVGSTSIPGGALPLESKSLSQQDTWPATSGE